MPSMGMWFTNLLLTAKVVSKHLKGYDDKITVLLF